MAHSLIHDNGEFGVHLSGHAARLTGVDVRGTRGAGSVAVHVDQSSALPLDVPGGSTVALSELRGLGVYDNEGTGVRIDEVMLMCAACDGPLDAGAPPRAYPAAKVVLEGGVVRNNGAVGVELFDSAVSVQGVVVDENIGAGLWGSGTVLDMAGTTVRNTREGPRMGGHNVVLKGSARWRPLAADSVSLRDNNLLGAAGEDLLVHNERLPLGGEVVVGEGEIGGAVVVGELDGLDVVGLEPRNAAPGLPGLERVSCAPACNECGPGSLPFPFDGGTECSEAWVCPAGWTRDVASRGCRPPPLPDDCAPGALPIPGGCSDPPGCTGDWVLAPDGVGCVPPELPECGDGEVALPAAGCVSFGGACGAGPFAPLPDGVAEESAIFVDAAAEGFGEGTRDNPYQQLLDVLFGFEEDEQVLMLAAGEYLLIPESLPFEAPTRLVGRCASMTSVEMLGEVSAGALRMARARVLGAFGPSLHAVGGTLVGDQLLIDDGGEGAVLVETGGGVTLRRSRLTADPAGAQPAVTVSGGSFDCEACEITGGAGAGVRALGLPPEAASVTLVATTIRGVRAAGELEGDGVAGEGSGVSLELVDVDISGLPGAGVSSTESQDLSMSRVRLSGNALGAQRAALEIRGTARVDLASLSIEGDGAALRASETTGGMDSIRVRGGGSARFDGGSNVDADGFSVAGVEGTAVRVEGADTRLAAHAVHVADAGSDDEGAVVVGPGATAEFNASVVRSNGAGLRHQGAALTVGDSALTAETQPVVESGGGELNLHRVRLVSESGVGVLALGGGREPQRERGRRRAAGDPARAGRRQRGPDRSGGGRPRRRRGAQRVRREPHPDLRDRRRVLRRFTHGGDSRHRHGRPRHGGHRAGPEPMRRVVGGPRRERRAHGRGARRRPVRRRTP